MHSSSSLSSSRTKNPCHDDKSTTKSTDTSKSNGKLTKLDLPLSILSPSSLLFFKSPSLITTQLHPNTNPILNLQKIVTASPDSFVRNFHNSIDKCLRDFHHFASNNPLFTKLHSAASQYHKFCQINFRSDMKSNNLSNHNFAAILPGDSLAGLVVSNGILNFLNIYNSLLVARLVLTWFPNTPQVIVNPLSTLCDPYLNIFRGVIPPLGGTLDLSPILAFLVLNALTSTASALPAELPSQRGSSSEKHPSFLTSISHLTTSQKKWLKRFNADKSKGSECNL
ncbi:ylmG homolog protein 2, chloroplastic [Lactuca sativa]|uniref:YGGT family protein n=1 Tax=Lactuca sativa TaxID=4236 RepID=A0A9R1X2T9_LACSA|nr:ylmG homolog protein 2, chloroplastic [Lactuca sativa]KAJ0196329.1 hypothetical protein LSAT_V11C700366100 [Lactuca sativa]